MAAPKHRSRFLSTPSARRATLGGVCFFLCAVISIHALCEEGDSTPARRRSWLIYFYPRPLRGGRPSPSRLTPSSCYFYPRPLRGGRPDAGPARLIDLLGISIHALCEEGDRRSGCTSQLTQRFLSTPSARRATRCTCPEAVAAYEFLSTPSARRATRQLSVKRSDQS